VPQLPAARIDAREERQRLLALRLGGEVAAVFGNVADEEHRVVEHHEVLLAGVARVTRELFPGTSSSLIAMPRASRMRSNCG